MDSIDFGHSMKNTPTHSKLSYLYKLIGKVEKVLKDIQTMIESIKFKSSRNKFQQKLKTDIKLINSLKNIFLSADKTQNFYEIEKIMKK